MGKRSGKTIAIRTTIGSQPRKLTKVVGYGSQGFAVLMPYHEANSGWVGKVPVDYKKIGGSYISVDDLISFTAEDRVKLSYHPDGFAQFSGEVQGKVISGRNPKTGEPKGIGLMTQPLSNPIRTGPSFGVTAWGLDDFVELGKKEDALVFEPEDMYFRNCTQETANGFILEVFVFPKRYWAATRQRDGEYRLTLSFIGFEASYGVIEMKVLDLPDQDILLAGFVSHFNVSFTTTSGWVLNGPGNHNDSGQGHVLFAIYPRQNASLINSSALDRMHL
jgi:hypothetical protein